MDGRVRPWDDVTDVMRYNGTVVPVTLLATP